ncbi:MAG: dienelactone hydrolase family protein [Desulfotomaculaceae bacterium]|nr:dienelactone hydrolase family protein [Desulfotomaculaceae bacterium]
MRKARRINTILNNHGLLLEACLELPDLPGRYPGVVLCHPDPRYGGSMDNNIIMAVSQELTQVGIAGLSFNFRGVGRSQGSFGGGIPEQSDARAALDFLSRHEEINPARIGIMGYSFGGRVALPVGSTDNIVKAIAGVSPVIPAGALRVCTKPKLIICGAEDDVIPASNVLREAEDMPQPKIIEVLPGIDHFWWGGEEELAGIVAGFFADSLAG